MDWTDVEHALNQHPIMNIDPDKALVSIVAAIVFAGRLSADDHLDYAFLSLISESVGHAKMLIQEASKK